MLNITAIQSLEVFQTIWTFTQDYLSSYNATEISYKLYESMNAITTINSDFIILFIIFFMLYIAWSISKALCSWVWSVVKFAFWVSLFVGLYWLWVSVDVQRGNQEIRITAQKVVSGVKGAVREAVINSERDEL
ncbi:11154_t:CDS:1 [Ambispora gerdemannii]|uniref:11154_t:CDS:1 n=1 Tax=Ambispora gerdemannii TaxID=144530 RepID=A0A9N8YTE9_9GLOM|nr:11154_t:CDS:1 [Ambispora gerdemannii]